MWLRGLFKKINIRENNYEKFHCEHLTEELPMSYGSDAPIYYYEVPQMERKKRFKLNPDTCIMDKQHYFIRGCIDIPIIDSDETFTWIVWVSLSETNFFRAIELWEKEGRETEAPYFGWLSTSIPGYPDTTKLKTHVHTRQVGVRPFIELEPTDHILAVEQREGITLKRVAEIREIVNTYNLEEDSE